MTSAMKFWQLSSLMRSEPHILIEVAGTRPAWRYIVEWLQNRDRIVNAGDRAKLDHELPVDFVRAALRNSRIRFYVSTGHVLRTRRRSFLDLRLSALKAFDRYGGQALEEALEHGSFDTRADR